MLQRERFKLQPGSSLSPPTDYIGSMSYTLWIGQRFLLNERGQYTVSGACGTARIVVEIDPSIVIDLGDVPERRLMNIRPAIQAAARRKWEAGESNPEYFSHSGRLKHHSIALTAEDLRGLFGSGAEPQPANEQGSAQL